MSCVLVKSHNAKSGVETKETRGRLSGVAERRRSYEADSLDGEGKTNVAQVPAQVST